MQHTHPRSTPRGRPRQGAHERLKRNWNRILFGSIFSAVLIHAGIFHLWPETTIESRFRQAYAPTHLLALASELTYDLPAPPGAMPVPSLPTVEALTLEVDDLALEQMDGLLPEFFERIQIDLDLPPAPAENVEFARYVHFAPTMVRPRITNMNDVKRFLRRHYRPILDATGITGQVRVNFWIDEAGEVQKADIMASSGSSALDRLAMELSEIVRFSPARTRDIPVAVQVMIPIVFEAI